MFNVANKKTAVLLIKITVNEHREWRGCENALKKTLRSNRVMSCSSGVPRGFGGGVRTQPPPSPEIPKALQNRAKLNPTVKTVKNY